MCTTVLVVDDHAGFRARVRAMLEAHGFDVVGEVADGQAAVAEAARLQPDLALVDIQLPDIDGFIVAARLREAGSARRIVLISGRDREDYGGRVETSAADGFIAKFDLSGERLIAALE
ncbi:MAG: response regulator transcription factor [Chloroflexi bacterium]|nr:response regulator transcription factor [Chloroflexota bacterium]